MRTEAWLLQSTRLLPRSPLLFVLQAWCLNSLICLVFLRNKKLLKAPDIFIVNVALSDLFYSVATLPLLFVANVYGRWIFGPQGCKATAFISTWSGLSSLMNLSLAAYERYVALAFLFKSQRTFTRRKAARGSVCHVVVCFVLECDAFVWLVRF